MSAPRVAPVSPPRRARADAILVIVLAAAVVALALLPTGRENLLPKNAATVSAVVRSVDDGGLLPYSPVSVVGNQIVEVELLDDPWSGRVVRAENLLSGQADFDKIFEPGDRILVTLTLGRDGTIRHAVAFEHDRLGVELLLLCLFAAALLAVAGWTGAKALLSFVFAALLVWKVMVPAFLAGWAPLPTAAALAAILAGVICLLVGGWNRRGAAAFAGTLLGLLLTCGLATVFSNLFAVHGYVRPFAAMLQKTPGCEHLDMLGIFLAGIVVTCSGALMDLAMDISAGMDELARKRPDLSRRELMRSGFAVGRAVIGTMTTTLLLAYCGGYLNVLMVAQARGYPPTNLFTMNFFAAEILNTLVGSFGLVTVAPFTALVGGLLFARGSDVGVPPSAADASSVGESVSSEQA